MNLAELIYALRLKGDKISSWCGTETNVESIEELQSEDNKLTIKIKIKDD